MARVRTNDPGGLVEAARDGDRGALARLLSMIEHGGQEARDVGRLTYPLGGRAYTIGITGAPGSGKSTLTNALIAEMRAGDETVGVLAIDPSSPFTGGAILGDRVRMGDHTLDDGVFIRSMATRGHLGGLALATPEAVRALDAVGILWVIVETVGVGQVEVEVANAADTTIVVVNPGWGDSVQANKAGLMEIADIFAINKADRPQASETRRDLEQMLELSNLLGESAWPERTELAGTELAGTELAGTELAGTELAGTEPVDAQQGHANVPTAELGDRAGWRPPIVSTIATTGEAVSELWAEIQRHRLNLSDTGELDRRRARRLTDELHRIVAERLLDRARQARDGAEFDRLRDRVLAREIDPWAAADELLDLED